LKYNGLVNQDRLGAIEYALENEHQTIFLNSRKKEKLLTIFYELGQNIMKYGIQSPDDDLSIQPVFEFIHMPESGEYSITAKNIIPETSMQLIKNRIDEANAVDREDISKVYKELRKSRKYSHDNGAGIGFFEFSKRSTRKIQYTFDKIDDNRYYYSITVTI
jgi:hypothetical protein